MDSYSILDCTLRDGGYVNNWEFGKDCIKTVLRELNNANIDIVECGFISSKKFSSEDNTIFDNFTSPLNYISDSWSSFLVAMVNYGEFDLESIPQYEKNITIDGIRVAFHKKDIKEALAFIRGIKEKGYAVFVQPMVTGLYSDLELLDLISAVNEIQPQAIYIVDSFGTMQNDDVLRIFYIYDHNLSPRISIGFHSHNNLQLSFSDTQSLLNSDTNHHIIIDSSIQGMGRGAGNLCTELLANYLNEKYRGKYDLVHILNVIDECIGPLKGKYQWGYSTPYYLAAIYNCHPNYATFLSGKQTLSIKDLGLILSTLDQKKKIFYDQAYIEAEYLNYQNRVVDDSDVLSRLSSQLRDRTVMLLAPGKSIALEDDEINAFINNHNPFVISVNFLPENYSVDLVFIGNKRRYSQIVDAISDTHLLVTSNLLSPHDNMLNYSDYLNDDPIISDNSGTMLINLMIRVGVKELFLAGFDGFSLDRSNNYFNRSMENPVESEQIFEMNKSMHRYFNKIKSKVNIHFITSSGFDV